MTPNEYQELASRTECDQHKALERISRETHNHDPIAIRNVRILHSIIGLGGEVGELCTEFQRHTFYGKDVDLINLKEEYGDILWYVAEGLNALGISMEDVMKANIAKLKVRYPTKFTEDKAANRDLSAERAALELPTVPPPLDEKLKALVGKEVRAKFQSSPYFDWKNDSTWIIRAAFPPGWKGHEPVAYVLEIRRTQDGKEETVLADEWMVV
jgi:NTP pyrophosphatase (non-canonical NTP hydrolase)